MFDMWYICFTTDRPYVYQKYIRLILQMESFLTEQVFGKMKNGNLDGAA